MELLSCLAMHSTFCLDCMQKLYFSYVPHHLAYIITSVLYLHQANTKNS